MSLYDQVFLKLFEETLKVEGIEYFRSESVALKERAAELHRITYELVKQQPDSALYEKKPPHYPKNKNEPKPLGNNNNNIVDLNKTWLHILTEKTEEAM